MNSVFKNIWVGLKAWFKRYPSAWVLLPVYLILLLGYLLIGYIPGWLFMDLVCFLKDKKKKEKE